MKKVFIGLVLLVLIISTVFKIVSLQSKDCTTNEVKIRPIIMLDRIDTAKVNNIMYKKSNYFLINKYCDTEGFNKFLDSIACNLIASDYFDYHNYALIIYEETKYTNEAYLKKNPRSFYRYSLKHDRVAKYRHSSSMPKGSFVKTTNINGKNESVYITCFDLE